VSLTEFQRAFADLIASPERCLEAREEPSKVFGSYELTRREQLRLTCMVRSAAMSVNCTLYRVNRLTPIYSVLPLTCSLLGDQLRSELEAFCALSDHATSQYRREALRFAKWLLDRISSGMLRGGPIEDAIAFERAAFDVRTAPRIPNRSDGHLHPRKRLLRFTYDPDVVLNPAKGGNSSPRRCGEEEWVLLDATGDSLTVFRLRGPYGAVYEAAVGGLVGQACVLQSSQIL
jgi:hypothetical protein